MQLVEMLEREQFIAWLEDEMAARNWRPADLARAIPANIAAPTWWRIGQ